MTHASSVPDPSTSALRRRSLAGVLSVLPLLLVACGGDDPGASVEPMVQDSAGVQIITNPGAGSWAAEEAWTVEEDWRVGVETGDPELQFGRIAGVDADASGRVYVFDQQAQRLRVFDAEGNLVTAFGRAGGGPGELSQQAAGVFVESDGVVMIPDLGNMRLARFTADGEALESPPLDPQAQGIPILFNRTADGALVAQFRTFSVPGQGSMGTDAEGGDRLVRMEPGTADGETLARVTAGETVSFGADGMPSFMFFSPEPVWAVLSDGRLVTGTNDEYSLTLHDAGASEGTQAEARTIVRRSVNVVPVTERHQESVRDLLREQFEQSGQPIPQEIVEGMLAGMGFAPNWPALAALMAGPDGTLWVQRVEAGSVENLTAEDLQANRIGSPLWDVFSPDGSYLGEVAMPDRVTAVRFVGDHLYGIHADELEVQRVVRLRLIRPGG